MEEARTVEREHKHGVEADMSALFGLDRLISKSTREVLGLLLDRRDAFLESYIAYMDKGGVVQDEGDRQVIRQLFCDLWLHSVAYLLDVGSITISQRNRLLQDLTDLFCCKEGASENYYRNVEQNPAYLSYMQSCFGINADSPYLFWRFVFSVDEKGTEGFAANRLLDEYGGLLMQIGYYLERWFPENGFLDRALELAREFFAEVMQGEDGSFDAKDLVNPVVFHRG